MFPLDGSVAEAINYCRDPNGEMDSTWCFTVDSSVRWEYCHPVTCISMIFVVFVYFIYNAYSYIGFWAFWKKYGAYYLFEHYFW